MQPEHPQSGQDELHQMPSPKREPIFNRMPMGVVILVGLILVAHLIVGLASPQASMFAQTHYGVVPAMVLSDLASGHYWAAILPLLMHQFMHGGTLHLVMNLAMLVQAGPIAEMGLSRKQDGVARFVSLFLISGACGAVLYCLINPTSDAPTIGASGAISGVFAGFLWAAIGNAKPGQPMLRPVLASAAVFLLINVGLAWVARVLNFVPIAWESHLGGFLGGLVFYPIIARIGRQH